MKVLFLHDDHREPGQGGGAESILRDVSAGLRKRGHTVEWWYGQVPLADMVTRFQPDICNVQTVHTRFGMHPLLYLQRNHIPHVLVLMDYWPFCGPRMLLDKDNLSCAAVSGVCDGQCGAQPAPALIRETVNKSVVVVLAQTTREIYERNGIRVDAAIGCGIDTEFFKPDPAKRQWGAVITSSAWPEYQTKGMHILQAAAERIGVKVRLVAHVTRAELRDALQEASIYVFPSTYEETWGLCLTEAMASGLACIASNVTGPRAQIADGVNGILFENRNVDDLAGKLRQLIDEPAEQQRLGWAAREWAVKRANIDVVAERYERLYKAVLNE